MNSPTEKNVRIIKCTAAYDITCGMGWHYIVPHDGGRILKDQPCDCLNKIEEEII